MSYTGHSDVDQGKTDFTPLAGGRRRQRWTSSMVHGENRISYRIDRRLNGLAGPDYDATISFGVCLGSGFPRWTSGCRVVPTMRWRVAQRTRPFGTRETTVNG